MANYLSALKGKLNRYLQQQPRGKIESYIVKYLDTSKAITVIDIGAHRGDFVNELGKFYRIEKAALVEPTPDLAKYLALTFKDAGFTIIQAALSDKDYGSVEFNINMYGETSSILELNAGMKELSDVDTRLNKAIHVTTRTLDSIAAELQYGQVDLIKIDVQGVEHLVLKGGERALSGTRYVWIELSFKPLYLGSSVFHDIYTIMEQYGFRLLEISPGHRSPAGELLQADALFVNPTLSGQ